MSERKEERAEGVFDRFAAWSSTQVARAWFFALCVLLVVVWAPSLPLFGKVDTWQLVINTATTILTFLLVALLQNTQDRTTRAINHKLDALAEGLAYILDEDENDRDKAKAHAAELVRMAHVEMEASE